jgi:hypothetical protein
LVRLWRICAPFCLGASLNATPIPYPYQAQGLLYGEASRAQRRRQYERLEIETKEMRVLWEALHVESVSSVQKVDEGRTG